MSLDKGPSPRQKQALDMVRRNDAEAQLSLASSALKEKRYEEAILAARKAIESARKLMG